jgi:beta-phosphoglucomutase-like phosphatase (HAD superfamily)
MPIAICSGAVLSDIELILPALGDGSLMRRFAAIVTADDVQRSKPDPACYRMAAQRLGEQAHACLAIEDTAAGLTAARDAGMRTLGVAHTHGREALNADHAVGELAEVTLAKLRTWYG